MKYFAVIGRMLWKDDNNYAICFAQRDDGDRDAAIKAFKDIVYFEHDVDQSEQERLEANGDGVSIDQILCSDSPIEEC